MAVDREALFVALFNRIKTAAGFKLFSRTWQSWDNNAPAESPAAFLTKADETPNVAIQGLPSLWMIEADLVIYVINDQGDTPPSTLLNALLQKIEATLERQPTDGPLSGAIFPNNPNGTSFGTTLGGLCYSCQIAGKVEVFEGLIGGNAMAIIPIAILTTA